MWWLSQAKLKDVLNRWICSSFQPMSAQNIPHLDPRGSWKHFCGTPGEFNWTLLMYRMSCKRYGTKIHSPGAALGFREGNPWNSWSSLQPPLIAAHGAWQFICSRDQCLWSAAETHLASSLLPTTTFDRKRGFAPIVQENWPRSSNWRRRARREDGIEREVATSAWSWPNQGKKAKPKVVLGLYMRAYALV